MALGPPSVGKIVRCDAKKSGSGGKRGRPRKQAKEVPPFFLYPSPPAHLEYLRPTTGGFEVRSWWVEEPKPPPPDAVFDCWIGDDEDIYIPTQEEQDEYYAQVKKWIQDCKDADEGYRRICEELEEDWMRRYHRTECGSS